MKASHCRPEEPGRYPKNESLAVSDHCPRERFHRLNGRESRAILVSFGIEIADGIGCNPM